MPFFTVVIPLYNKEKFVASAVKSVLAQTFTDFEVLIVDDCSADKSLEVVSTIKSEKIRILHHEKNSGLSASRNTGIKNAKSGYIAFLDADDLWKPDFLETIYALTQRFPEAGLFATGYEELYPGNVTVKPSLNLGNFEKQGIIPDFFESSLGQPIYHPCSLCVRKSVFDKVGYFNERITFGEDVDFNIRSNLAFSLAYSAEPLVVYTMVSENQITGSNLKGKVITDFSSYEGQAVTNPSLKKYLDFNRYIMARYYKAENDAVNFTKMTNRIHPDPKISGLNYKQRFLLSSPVFVVRGIKKLRDFLIRKGIRFTTFG